MTRGRMGRVTSGVGIALCALCLATGAFAATGARRPEAKAAEPRTRTAEPRTMTAEDARKLGDAARRTSEAQQRTWDRKVKALSGSICSGC